MAEEIKEEAEKKYTFGLSKNVACMLAYFFGWVGGLVFWLAEKEDEEIRFCGAQSLVTFGFFSLLSFFPLRLLRPLVWLAQLVLWLVLVIRAYQGQMVRVPVAADLADKLVKKSVV